MFAVVWVLLWSRTQWCFSPSEFWVFEACLLKHSLLICLWLDEITPAVLTLTWPTATDNSHFYSAVFCPCLGSVSDVTALVVTGNTRCEVTAKHFYSQHFTHTFALYLFCCLYSLFVLELCCFMTLALSASDLDFTVGIKHTDVTSLSAWLDVTFLVSVRCESFCLSRSSPNLCDSSLTLKFSCN